MSVDEDLTMLNDILLTQNDTIFAEYNEFNNLNIKLNEEINEDIIIKINIIDKIFNDINDIFNEFKNIRVGIKELQNKIIVLKKDYTKLMNQMQKEQDKKDKKKTSLQSGFTKPRKISPEMLEFLELEPDTLWGRNIITTKINNYIVSNDLRDTLDRRIILPNNELKKILRIENIDIVLSYFNIQTFLKVHFI